MVPSRHINMKRFVGIFAVFALIGFAGCRDFSVNQDGENSNERSHRKFTVSGDGPFEMSQGDVIHVEGTNLTMEFRFVLSDSRCPTNVLCIHPGDAEILLDISSSDNRLLQIQAHIPGLVPTPYETNNIIQFEGYRFQLLRLSPYPVDGTEQPKESDYVALINISSVF